MSTLWFEDRGYGQRVPDMILDICKPREDFFADLRIMEAVLGLGDMEASDAGNRRDEEDTDES